VQAREFVRVFCSGRNFSLVPNQLQNL